jgi:DNA repair protein RecO (recombination protein O)
MRMSDSSKLATLITERYGLVSVVAKGARRPKSKYGAALEPITLIDCRYWHKDTRELQTITDVEIEDAYLPLKDDMRQMATACCMIEVARSQTAPGDVTATAFTLLVESLSDLNAAKSSQADKHLWRFMLRFLADSGYRPVLDTCLACGTPPRGGKVFLSYADGGMLCSCTEPGERFGFSISPGALLVMRDLAASQAKDISRIKLPAAQRREVEEAVLKFLAYHTGRTRPPKSLSFLRKLKQSK